MKGDNKRKFSVSKMILCCIILGVMAGTSFFAARRIDGVIDNKEVSPVNTAQTTEGLMSTSIVSGSSVTVGGGVSEVAEQVLPSIVQLNVVSVSQSSDIFGRSQEREATGSGSGIIISQKNDEILIVE